MYRRRHLSPHLLEIYIFFNFSVCIKIFLLNENLIKNFSYTRREMLLCVFFFFWFGIALCAVCVRRGASYLLRDEMKSMEYYVGTKFM